MSLRRSLLKGRGGIPPIPENEVCSNSQSHSETKDLRVPRIRKDISPLEWKYFFENKIEVTINSNESFCVYTSGVNGPIFYLLHGGGYTGLTWACFAKCLMYKVECRIFAPDLRCHGDSLEDYDVSKDRMVDDIIALHQAHFGENESAPTILIGHSMGGALAVHAAIINRIKSVSALVVIDVTEERAMENLVFMERHVKQRPQQFTTIEEAIDWSLRSKTCQNNQAARISVPSQLKKVDDFYTWKTDLIKTAPHWISWFKDLSKNFVSTRVPKLLVLTSTANLDAVLLTAQMEGKFQSTILPASGHSIQEDIPERLSEVVAIFAKRFLLCVAK